MLKLEPTGKPYHDATKHSYLSVLIEPNYVDASTQLTPFKQYPHFYRRFKLEAGNPTHDLIRLTSAITFNKHYKDGPYQLRVNPSAGALYPTEIYVQLRGIRGTIDGIYHLAYQTTLLPPSLKQAITPPQFEFKSERFLQAILNRRSARRFKKTAISKADFLTILQRLAQPIPTKSAEDLAIYLIVNRVEGMEPGLYQNTHLLQVGDFSEKAGYLCINQAIARDSAITLFLTAHDKNYQTAMQVAGWIGQRLYLLSDYLGLGCSGIGAYYDDETQTFLATDRAVLYAFAIGL
jgi:nitroreductase